MKIIAGLIGVIVISLMLTSEKAVAEQKEVSEGIFDALSISLDVAFLYGPIDGFVQTPKSQEELSAWIDSALPESERHLGHMIMLMTWNLCADIVDPDLDLGIELTPNEKGELDEADCSLKFY